MNKSLIGLLLSAVIPFSVLAQPEPTTQINIIKENTNQNNTQIVIYEKPDLKSSALTRVAFNQRVVPFYRENDWLKVGLPSNGMVGWVNIPEYIKAREVYYQAVTNKIPSDILVIQNGKKLDDAEAKLLYQQYQQQLYELWQERVAGMQKMILQNLNFAPNDWLNSSPIIIIQDSNKTNKNTNQNENKN